MKYLIMFFIALLTTGCLDTVPAGHLGSCLTSTGFGSVEESGSISCWGLFHKARLHNVEVSDADHSVKMNVLCKDSLNFSFNINVLASTNKDNIKEILKQVTASEFRDGYYVITGKDVFDRYAKNLVDQEARRVVSKYETAEIVLNRERILNELQKAMAEAFKGNKMVNIKRVTVNNLQFPEVITKAQEQRAQRNVEIETEKAEQSKRRLKLVNQMELAEANAKIALIEAQVVADTNKIIGSSITPGYLAWYQTHTFSEAAKGPNNWGFIPYNPDASKNVDALPAAIDAATRKRLDNAINGPMSFEKKEEKASE